MAFKVLVAEDEEITRKHIANTLKAEGYEVEDVNNGLDALKKIRADNFDILIADIKMPKMDGLELLGHVKEESPDTEVIVITGFGSINSAVNAMKNGAYDYITKPFELDEILIKVNKVLDQKQIKNENVALKAYLNIDSEISFVAKSEKMKNVLKMIQCIQDSDCSVLLTGESGVGKNLMAKVIHHSSSRSNNPMLSINCATLNEELLASELMGHEKGSFTGAVSQKLGLMEIADNSTLYLDEIVEMPISLQAKLLKVIEEQEFFRVGGTKPVKVDVRLIAATNQKIVQAISKGDFRKDLYYRLNIMEIYIPPLRERKKDIEPLSRHFLAKHLRTYLKKINGFSKDAMSILKGYSFPGNVRELENIIERAIILEKTNSITLTSLPQTLKQFQIETLGPDSIAPIAEINKQYAQSVIEMVGGNKAEAARLLGISRTSLWRLLKK